jgi:hypothetical protein
MPPTINITVTEGVATREQLETTVNTALATLQTRAGPGYDTIAAAAADTIDETVSHVTVDGVEFARTTTTYRLGGTSGGDQFSSADGAKWVRADLIATNDRLPIVVIATGQSNSLGVSAGNGGDIASRPGVWSYERHPTGDQTTGWKLGFKNSPDYPTGQTGNHFSYHFCARLARATNRPVCHIPYSIGGRDVAEWIPAGGGLSGATGIMWDNLRSAFAQAQGVALPFRSDSATLASLGLTTADYVLWHQGEANSDGAALYGGSEGANFTRDLLRALRAMEAPSSASSSAAALIRADTPIVMGELLTGGANSDRNLEMLQLANEVTNLRWARVGHLPADDGVHYDAEHIERMADYYWDALHREEGGGFTLTLAAGGFYQFRPSHLAGAYAVSDANGSSRLHFGFGYRVTASSPQISPWNAEPGADLIEYNDNVDLSTLGNTTDTALGLSARKNRIQIRNRRSGSLTLRFVSLVRQPLSSANLVAD